MSFQIGNLDIGVAFAGDVSGLQQATGAAGAAVDSFGKKTSQSLKGVADEAKKTDDAMGRLATGIKGAFVGGSVAVGLIKLKNTIIETSDALIQAQVQLDKWNNGFKFGAGGASGGARELAFVRDEASRLGLELGGAATQYMKMVAAARGTNMEGNKTRQLFTSIAEASTVMGMSGEQSERAMAAVVQMMSKGKVQAEELRGQLGEHLPGAFAIAARAMNVTEAELNKLMETGQVVAADFLPKFAAQLRGELAGSVDDATKSMQASLNRFETAWLTFKQNVAQQGAGDVIKSQIDYWGKALNNINELQQASRASGGGFWAQDFAQFKGIAAAINPLNVLTQSALDLNGRLSEAKDRLAELEKERPYSGNIFLGPKIEETRLLIAELERAKLARDQLARPAGTGLSESRYSAIVDDAALAAQRAKGQAYATLFDKMATPQEKFTEAVFEAKKNLGELYSPEVEARLREHFIKPTRQAKEKVDEFARALESVQEKDSGLNNNYTETLAALYAGFQKGRIGVDDYADAVEALIKQQPFYKKGLEDEKKAQDEATKATIEAAKANNAAFDEFFDRQEKARLAVESRIKAGRETLEQLQFETSLLGMNAQQRAVATAMRELERQGVVKGTEAYEKYAEAIKSGIINLETQREDLDYWKSIESTAKGVWTDVADGGVSAFERVGKTIKASILDALWQATGRKWLIQAGVSMGVPGASLAAQQAGMGGAVGTAANIYSLYGAAGQAGAFVGSLGSAASYGTAIGSQQGAMLAAQEMGMGTMAGNAAGLGAALPWIGGAIALLSLISSMDDSGTMHTGGSAIADSLDGIRQVESATIGFGLAAADVSTQVVGSSKQLAGSMLGILQGLDKLSGGTGKYSVATGFADDSSKDGAWGSLAISKNGKTVVDWRDTQTSRWAPKEFADGEAGAKQYGDAVAASVKQAIDTIDLPDWAATMVKRLGDTPTMDQLTETIANIVAMPEQMLQSIGTSTQQLADMIYLGMQASDPMGAGKAVADQITYGIEASLHNNFAAQITGIISTQLVTPVLTAMAAGSTLTEAMATASIATMKTQVAAAGAAFAAIVGDPGFKAALAEVNSIITAVVGNAMGGGGVAAPLAPTEYNPFPQLDKATETGATKAADILSGLLDEEKKLRLQEAQVFGDTAEELRLLTLGMTDFEKELFLSNRSLAENIAAQERVNDLTDERKTLELDLLRAQGATAAALVLFTAEMSAAERASYLLNEGLRTQIKGAGEATTLNERLLTAQDNIAALRAIELSALEESNRPLQARIWALEDEKAATVKLTAAIASMVSAADGTAGKYLSGRALTGYQYARAAENINALGLGSVNATQLENATIDNIRAAVTEVVLLGSAAPEVKAQLINLGASLIDLKQAAIDAAAATAKARQAQQLDMQKQIAELSGDYASLVLLRQQEIDQMDGPLLQGMARYIDALKAQAAATAKEASRQAQQTSLQRQIADLSGDKATLLAFRELEIAQLDGPLNQALQRYIYTLQDQKTALEDAAKGTDAAYSAVERAVAAQRKTHETQRTAAQQLAQEVGSIFDTLKSNIRDLSGEVDSTKKFIGAAGQQFITASLAAARAGGGLPDGQDLADAISASRAAIDVNNYTSRAGFDRDKLSLIGQLSQLQAISGTQKSAAEQQIATAQAQLDALDQTLETAKTQIDTLRDIDNSVIGVEVAVYKLALAVAAERMAAKVGASGAAGAAATGTTAGGIAAAAAAGVDLSAVSSGAAPGVGVFLDAVANLPGKVSDQFVQEQVAVFEAIAAKNPVLTAEEAALKVYKDTLSYVPSGLLNDQVKQMIWANAGLSGAPTFATGGAFTNGIVSRPTMFDMAQMGEAGSEAIMPLANIGGSLGVRYAGPDFGSFGRGMEAMAAEITALRAEVQGLRAEARATAVNTGRTQDLLKRVSRNGEALQTEAAT